MTDDPKPMTTRKPRSDDTGRYLPDTTTADHDAEAATLRARGWGFQRIADHQGTSVSTAYERVERALKAARREAGAEALELELRRLDASLERLDEMEALVRQTLSRQHITVSQGKAVYDDTGEAVWDDEFVLKAVDRLTKIEAQRERVGGRLAELRGMKAPAQAHITGEVTYVIKGLEDGP